MLRRYRNRRFNYYYYYYYYYCIHDSNEIPTDTLMFDAFVERWLGQDNYYIVYICYARYASARQT